MSGTEKTSRYFRVVNDGCAPALYKVANLRLCPRPLQSSKFTAVPSCHFLSRLLITVST
nr:MAG TPA_asm: hypothetical protein [Caudoviricetes sp.]